jgi:hypothetical protein
VRCSHCGNGARGTANKRYCSPACRHLAAVERHQLEPWRQATCAVCETHYARRHGNGGACSAPCALAVRRARWLLLRIEQVRSTPPRLPECRPVNLAAPTHGD